MNPHTKEDRESDPAQSFRYEIKVPLQRQQYVEFERYVKRSGWFPRQAFPPRQVHSIYLETPSFEDYLANVAGISSRKKVRIRWYDDKPEKMALEFKIKRNKASRKHIVELSNELGTLPVNRSALVKLLGQQPGHVETRELFGTFPMLEVVYERRYLVLDHQVSMTIDTEMQFRRLYPIASTRLDRSPVDFVVEFKFPVQAERKVKSMLSGIPFRSFRHSKYVVGMDVSAG